MFEAAAPALREAKPAWSQVPTAAIRGLEAALGAAVTRGEIAWGGYGPGASFILHLADGSRRFVKARHPEQTREGNAMLAEEIAARRRYPFIDKVAPAFLGAVPAGDWQWLVFEHIDDALPALPWTPQKLEAVFAALGRIFADSRHLKPRDSDPDPFEKTLPVASGNWHALAEDAALQAEFLGAFVEPDAAAAWLARCLPVLRPLQTARRELGGPTGLAHFDLRSDNLLFRPDGTALLLDWSEASIGALAVELCGFAPSCIGEGGASGETLRMLYQRSLGVAIPDRDVAIALANVAGFFAARVGKPWRPAMPRLRWVVRQQFWGAMQWAETLLALPPLPRLRSDNLASD
ncbi:phosphotransferase family protein [Dongia sp. agr-C8]